LGGVYGEIKHSNSNEDQLSISGVIDWLGFNGTFSTLRLYLAFIFDVERSRIIGERTFGHPDIWPRDRRHSHFGVIDIGLLPPKSLCCYSSLYQCSPEFCIETTNVRVTKCPTTEFYPFSFTCVVAITTLGQRWSDSDQRLQTRSS